MGRLIFNVINNSQVRSSELNKEYKRLLNLKHCLILVEVCKSRTGAMPGRKLFKHAWISL